jgi:hypothetical protein
MFLLALIQMKNIFYLIQKPEYFGKMNFTKKKKPALIPRDGLPCAEGVIQSIDT